MFDYLPERPLEPPEDKILGYCECCGGEIYEGCEFYNIDGESVCEDCLGEFAAKYFADCYDADEELYTIDGEVLEDSDLWSFAHDYFSYCREVAELVRPGSWW